MPTQPTIVASNDNGVFSSTRSPATGTLSFTPQLNDVVVLVATMPQVGATAITVPVGWVNPLGSVLSTPSNGRMVVVYHQVDAGEVSAVTTSWTVTNLFDATKSGRAIAFVVRGTDPTAPIGVTANGSGNSSSWVLPNLLPMKTGGLVCGMGFINAITTGRSVTTPSAPWSTIAGLYTNAGSSRTGFTMQCSTPTVSNVAFSGVSLAISGADDWVSAAISFAPVPDPAAGAFFSFF